MKYLKKFEYYSPAPAPVKPGVKPDVKPGTKPSRPSRPSPIRRDRPSVEPAPKALKKASAREVANRFIQEVKDSGGSVKKYMK